MSVSNIKEVLEKIKAWNLTKTELEKLVEGIRLWKKLLDSKN